MTALLFFLFSLALFPVFAESEHHAGLAESEGHFEFDSGGPGIQGEPMQPGLRVSGPRPERVEFLLRGPDGSRHTSVEAIAIGEEEGATVWTALVGVSSTASSGEWRLYARIQYDTYGIEIAEAVEVEEGDFFERRIALNRELTSLVTDPDPQRQEESRELSELLYSHDPESVYHLGPFTMPVNPNRTSAGFGDRRIYEYADGSTSRSVHHGVDYAASTGEQVRSAAHGRVRFADHRIISGNSVIIEHLPGLYSLYYHLDSITVEEGEHVRAGDTLGEVGMTGLATGPHLHWEIRLGGIAVDPEWFLDRPTVDTESLLTTLGR